jgi:mRNA interferase RelE/StbE
LRELRLTRRAKQDLESLAGPVCEAVLGTLAAIRIDPETAGKRLVGRLEGLWSARVGNYRVLYTLEPIGIVVRAIRHRGAVYPRRGR